MGYPEVEVDARDEHVGLEPDLVYAWRRKRDREADHPHERRRRLPRVAERVLRPQSTEQQHDLFQSTRTARLDHHRCIASKVTFRALKNTYAIAGRLEVAATLRQRGLHAQTEGPVVALVQSARRQRHDRRYCKTFPRRYYRCFSVAYYLCIHHNTISVRSI